MSQDAAEQVEGRLLSDRQFCTSAGQRAEISDQRAGIQLSPHELLLLSLMEPHCTADLAGRMIRNFVGP